MTQVTITNLDHEALVQLKRLAWEQGIPPAEMGRRLLLDLLFSPDRARSQSAEPLELYRSLRENAFSLKYEARVN